MKNIITALSLLTIFWVNSTMAQSDIELGYPSAGGTGCPGGSVSASLSPDNSTLTLLFDSFLAQAGGMTGLSMDRKNCNISIPVRIPEGYSVSIMTVDYRGFISVPYGGMAQFRAEYFFAGMRGPVSQRTFPGGSEDNYTLTNRLGIQAIVWSACGEDVQLRVNSSILVKTNRYMEDALGTVDSADFHAGVVFRLSIQRCHGSSQHNSNW